MSACILVWQNESPCNYIFDKNLWFLINKISLLSFLFFCLFQSKAFLQTAASLAPHMYEPHFNLSILSEKVTNSWLVLLPPVSFFCFPLVAPINWGPGVMSLFRLEIFRAATLRHRSPRTRFRSTLTLSSSWSSCGSTFQCCRDPADSQCCPFVLDSRCESMNGDSKLTLLLDQQMCIRFRFCLLWKVNAHNLTSKKSHC